jgi:release factor glutamine methyltransferase
MDDAVGHAAMNDAGRPEPEGWLVERLARAGCVAPDEEAAELSAAAGADRSRLENLVARRESGEPLAWVTGWVHFAGVRVVVHPGVYVPRHQTEILVAAALAALPVDGTVVDLCTGSGAVAAALQQARPGATVLAADVDPAACRCARANGVTVFEGDLGGPLPTAWPGTADVVTAVAPYVPSDRIEFLPRDFRDWEPRPALDGGADGLAVVRQVVNAAAVLLRPGGTLVAEVGGDQADRLAPDLDKGGFEPPERLCDDEGDLRAIRARRRVRRG